MAFQEVIDAKQRIIQEFVPGKQVTIAMLLPILSPICLEKWGLRKKAAMPLEFLQSHLAKGPLLQPI